MTSVLLASTLLTMMFLHLGSEVIEGETQSLDTRVLLWAQALRQGRPWLVETMRDLSGLGGTTVLTVFAMLTVGYLLLLATPWTAALVAIATASGSVLVSIFKDSFGRVRPDESFAAAYSAGPSFPSGHASMSAVVFLTLGVLVASTRTKSSERMYILSCAALLAVLVGISRVALGVHWLTDVLGGWAFGTAWALLWLLVSRLLTRRTADRRLHPKAD